MRFFFCFCFLWGKQIQKTKGGVGREGGKEGRGLCNCNFDVCGNRGRLSSSYLALALLLNIDTSCALTSPRCQRFIRQSQQIFFFFFVVKTKKETIPTSSFPIYFFLFTNFLTFFFFFVKIVFLKLFNMIKK